MKYKIIADSSCELTEEMKRDMNIVIVPLTMQLRDKHYTDDEHLDIIAYLKEMKACPEAPKTACPAPAAFLKLFEGNEDSIFVVTLSNELSGTYNSALIARQMYEEERHDKFIHVFNSKSASVGETLTALKIKELIDLGLDGPEIVEETEKFIDDKETFFLLESLDHLAKNGRLNHMVAIMASLLAIKPIMGATKEGAIQLVHKVRGYKKAFSKLVETVGECGLNLSGRILGIAHCNCLERALEFKTEVEQRYQFKKIFIVEMKGLSSTYAVEGGLVIAF